MPGEDVLIRLLESADAGLLINSAEDIGSIVRVIYSKHEYWIHEDLVEELGGQIILLLLEDDYRRLRTFDSDKSSFRTWLTTVIEHHVSHYLQRQKSEESLDDLPFDRLSCPPVQETTLLAEERRAMLRSAIETLPLRQKQLIKLVLAETPTREIARRMNLKPESVHRNKYEIIQKLERILKNGR